MNQMSPGIPYQLKNQTAKCVDGLRDAQVLKAQPDTSQLPMGTH